MRKIKFGKQYMKNFKCHEEMEFSYSPERFVTIVGNNGAGKSSIFSGLIWACYNDTMEGLTGDNIVRKKSGKNTLVQVEWSDGENNYEVHSYRKDSKYGNKRFLLRNGIDISEEGGTDTLKKIETLLMPKDVFLNCLLFSQYIKRHFMDMTHSGQKELLDSMLLLDRFDHYYEGATRIYKNLDVAVSDIEKEITKVSTIIEQSKNDIEVRKSELSAYIQSHENKTSNINNEIEELTKEVRSINVTEEMIEAKQDEVNEVDNKYTLIEKELGWERERAENKMSDLKFKFGNEKLEELNALKTTYNEEFEIINVKINEMKDKKLEISNEQQKVLDSLDEAYNKHLKELVQKHENNITPLRENLSNTESQLKVKKLELDEFHKQRAKNSKKINEFNETLKSDNPTCDQCGQKLRSDDAINHIKSHISDIEKELDAIKTNINVCESQMKDLNEYRDKISTEIEMVIQENRDKSEKAEEKYNTKRSSIINERKETIQNIDDTLLQHQNEKNTLQSKSKADEEKIMDNLTSKYKKLIEDAKSEFNSFMGAINEKKQNQLSKLKLLRSELDELKSKKSKAISLLSQIDAKKATLQSIKESYNQKVEEHNKHIKEANDSIKLYNSKLKKLEEQIENISKKKTILNFWKKGFGDTGIKNVLLDESIPILNNRAKELCEYFPKIKLRFNSQTSLKSGDVRNKFSLDVLQTSNLSELKELSSGERRVADIMVMLCLRHLLEQTYNSKMNILLLDEILDSLDPENAMAAVNVVKNLSEDHCVVLISHTLRDYIEADETLTM